MKKIDDLLEQFLDRIGQSEGAPYVGLFSSWRSIVGDRIADHAEPVDVRGTSLVVEADHPGWVQMVMMSRARIIRELGRRYPELTITGLQIRVASSRSRTTSRAATGSDVGGGEPPAADATSEPVAAPPSASESEALNRIDDDSLRDSLERLREALDSDKPATE